MQEISVNVKKGIETKSYEGVSIESSMKVMNPHMKLFYHFLINFLFFNSLFLILEGYLIIHYFNSVVGNYYIDNV